MEIDLPLELEDITVWKIQYSSNVSYRNQVINMSGTEQFMPTALETALIDWVTIMIRRFPELIDIKESMWSEHSQSTLYNF